MKLLADVAHTLFHIDWVGVNALVLGGLSYTKTIHLASFVNAMVQYAKWPLAKKVLVNVNYINWR